MGDDAGRRGRPMTSERQTPKLGAFPFFIWYQFATAAAAALVTGVVFLLRDKREDE